MRACCWVLETVEMNRPIPSVESRYRAVAPKRRSKLP